MTDLLVRLQAVEASLAGQYGPFELFGLFRPRRRASDWDVVAAASWAYSGPQSVIELIVEELKRVGGAPALLMVSRVIANPDQRFVDAVHALVDIDHGLEVIGPGDYGSVEIARGYVITSRRPAAVAAASA